VIILLFFSNYAISQDCAGSDKFMCLGAESIQIGNPPTVGNNTCYKWFPNSGLSADNIPQPFASPSSTTTYNLVVTDDDGNIVCSDEMTVYVVDPAWYDLTIYKPKVFAKNNTTAIPEAIEESIGSNTFLNNDDDDADETMDISDNYVSTGDNELVRLDVSFLNNGVALNDVKIKVLNGANTIKFWRDSTKQAEFDPNTLISLPFVGKNQKGTLSLYIEGILPHNQQKEVIIQIEPQYPTFQGSPIDRNIPEDCFDKVALTVLNVASMEWIGVGNGLDTTSKSTVSNILDNDPNFPSSSSIKCQRVFPDGRIESGAVSASKDIVKLKIIFQIAPTADVEVFARSFDVDDPSSETVFIDPNDDDKDGEYSGTNNPPYSNSILYSRFEDNRGEVDSLQKLKSGLFIGQDTNQIKQFKLTAGQTTVFLEFQVGQHPGDNYRAVVIQDSVALKQSINYDKYHNFDIYHIVNTNLKSTKNKYKKNEQSPVLTVWRLLHLEYDSFKKFDEKDNQIYGNANEFSTNSAGLDRILQASTNKSIDDGSIYPGRFENGNGYIGSIPDTIHFDIQYNLGKEIQFVNGILPLLKYKLVNDSTGLVDTGSITQFKLNGIQYLFNILSNKGINIKEFNKNSRFKISTGNYKDVVAIDSIKNRIITNQTSIPFLIRDDDNENIILPYRSKLDTIQIPYNDTYIYILSDGGGIDSFNNSVNLSKINIIGNSDSLILKDMKLATNDKLSEYLENDNFWVAYICTGWQFIIKEDLDCDLEKNGNGSTRGISFDNIGYDAISDDKVVNGNKSSLLFIETILDSKTKFGAKIIAHEIGHQFGFSHGNSLPFLESNNMKLMVSNADNNTSLEFIDRHKNLIRSRIKSPGQ